MTGSEQSPVHSVMADLAIALQPVLQLDTGDVYGFEALMRSRDGGSVHPRRLLRRAQQENWLDGLESHLETLAFRAADRHLQGDEILFLNVARRIPPQEARYRRLMLHIREAECQRDLVARLHADRLELCLDDYGGAHGNLLSILDMRPEGLVLDRRFIHGISQDAIRFAIARRLNTLAQDLGIVLVAKGIETAEDLCAARRAGFTLGQGYYLGRPALVPSRFRLATVRRLLGGTVLESVTEARNRYVGSPSDS